MELSGAVGNKLACDQRPIRLLMPSFAVREKQRGGLSAILSFRALSEMVVLRSKAGFPPDLESTRMWEASLENAKQPPFGAY